MRLGWWATRLYYVPVISRAKLPPDTLVDLYYPTPTVGRRQVGSGRDWVDLDSTVLGEQLDSIQGEPWRELLDWSFVYSYCDITEI